METKICSVCNEKLSIDFFRKRKDSIDGYRNECKVCQNANWLKCYNKRNNIESNIDENSKKCSKCEVVYLKEKMFNKRKNCKDGYNSECKKCNKIRRDNDYKKKKQKEKIDVPLKYVLFANQNLKQ